jgi:hypothetical protein
LNAWSNYFAIVVFMPTLVVVSLILAIGKAPGRGPRAIWSVVSRPVLAFIAIGVGCLPLVNDLLAIARINPADTGASSGRIGDIGGSVVSALAANVLLANPLPSVPTLQITFALLNFLGLIVIAKSRKRNGAIIVVWALLPTVLLASIESTHVFYVRYVLPSLPMAILVALIGGLGLTPAWTKRRWPAIAIGGYVAVGVALSLLAVSGVRAYEETFVDTGPKKPNWRDAALTYAANAGPESCLVTIDAFGNGILGPVPFYLDRVEGSDCAIDARDPRLLEVTAAHLDVWWAIGTQWYDDIDQAVVVETFGDDADLVFFDLVGLVHPTTDFASSDGKLLEVLDRAMTVYEPEDCRGDIQAPAIREGLANVTLLQGGDPSTSAALVSGFENSLGENDFLMWDRVEQRLAWGDIAGARAFAVRLVGQYPGDSRAYANLATVEHAAGNPNWQVFDALAKELESGPAVVDAGSADPAC